MIVSFEVAKRLDKLGYHQDTKMKYWCRDKKAHSKFDNWEPIDTYQAPEVIEAINWAWERGTKITIREVDGGLCSAEVNIHGTIHTATSNTPEEAYSELLNLLVSENVLD